MRSPRRFINKTCIPSEKHFKLATYAQNLGLTMFDLAERIGLNRRAGYTWQNGAHVDPGDPASPVLSYVPERSYDKALAFLQGYAKQMRGAADVLLNEEDTPSGLSQPLESQDIPDSTGGVS